VGIVVHRLIFGRSFVFLEYEGQLVENKFLEIFGPLGGMVDTADSKSAFCWFESDRGHSSFIWRGPDDGMVDVTDLGSVFWQFKSASGHFTLLISYFKNWNDG
jgi:hypothetical protein